MRKADDENNNSHITFTKKFFIISAFLATFISISLLAISIYSESLISRSYAQTPIGICGQYTSSLIYQTSASSTLSSYSEAVVKAILDKAGLNSATISSTARTVEDQARIMYNNLEQFGVKNQKKLYGHAGDQVIDVYVASKALGKTPDQIKLDMINEINRLGASTVSRHLADPSLSNVFDIAPSSISDKQAFETELKNAQKAGLISKFFTPKDEDPAYHLEIPQPTSDPCGCPTGQVKDSTGQCQCIDPNQEIFNNQCVNKCPEGQPRDPSTGQCQQCPLDQTSCSGQCVDTNTDNANCGGCGIVCTGGQTCQFGVCSCPVGQTLCSGQCVDTKTDSNNCLSCGRVCTGGQTCQNSFCRCPVGQISCSGQCVDTNTDKNNCGGCGRVCSFSNQACEGGACVDKCPQGQSYCNGQCVDTRTDLNNCGGCGIVCGKEGFSEKLKCEQGACTCETDLIGAGFPHYQYCQNVAGTGKAGCTDKLNDRYNCGTLGCGNVCGLACTGQGTCISG